MTIHIAGFPVQATHGARQLCAWCGYVLIDIDGSEQTVLSKEESAPPVRFWETGILVKVHPKGQWVVREHVFDGKKYMPKGSCLDLPRPRHLKLVPPRIV